MIERISDRKKIITLLLCIFLGYLGIHNFYAGRVGRGLLFLLTGGLWSIGWIIDIFIILFGRFTDNYGAFIRE